MSAWIEDRIVTVSDAELAGFHAECIERVNAATKETQSRVVIEALEARCDTIVLELMRRGTLG